MKRRNVLWAVALSAVALVIAAFRDPSLFESVAIVAALGMVFLAVTA